MKILKEAPYSGGFVDAVIDGHWVQAKVFRQPSSYGINEGRVSKLAVAIDERPLGLSSGRNFHDNLIIHYDRGWDGDGGRNSEKLDSIVAQLENYAKDLEDFHEH